MQQFVFTRTKLLNFKQYFPFCFYNIVFKLTNREASIQIRTSSEVFRIPFCRIFGVNSAHWETDN